MSPGGRARLRSIGQAALALWRWWRADISALYWDCIERVAPRRARRAVLRIGPRGATIIMAGTRSEEECGTLFRASADGAWPDSLGDEWLALIRRAARTEVEIEDEAVLAHAVSFPRSMAPHLPAAVALQIERDAPLALEQLYTAWRPVVPRDSAAVRLSVKIVMTRREIVEAWKQRLRDWRCAAGPVIWRDASGERFRFGRVAPERQRAEWSRGDKRLLALAAALAVLWLGTALAQRIYERIEVNGERARLQDAVASAQADYAQYRRASAPLANLRARGDRGAALDALLALTNVIPDGAWAYQLDLSLAPGQDPEAKLSGFAPTPAALADTLEAAPQLERVALLSTSPGDVTAGTARFEIALRLRLRDSPQGAR